MLRKYTVVIAATASLLLASCSSTSLTNFQNNLGNFVTGVNSVNSAIATISTDLAQYCGGLQTFAIALQGFAAPGTKAAADFAATNAAIANYCQNLPTSLATTVTSAASAYNAAKAAYAAASATPAPAN